MELIEEVEEWMEGLIPIERNETTSWPIYDERMEGYFKALIQRIRTLKSSLAKSDERVRELERHFCPLSAKETAR